MVIRHHYHILEGKLVDHLLYKSLYFLRVKVVDTRVGCVDREES
jgi:hypothetical protein